MGKNVHQEISIVSTVTNMEVHLLGVQSGVTYHDVAVDGDGQNSEERHGHKAVACEGEELAQEVAVCPGALPEGGSSQRQVEAAEHEVGHTQVDDEDSGGITDLRADTHTHIQLSVRERHIDTPQLRLMDEL